MYPAADNFICPKCKTADGLIGVEALNTNTSISGLWTCDSCGSVIDFVISVRSPRHTCPECGERH